MDLCFRLLCLKFNIKMNKALLIVLKCFINILNLKIYWNLLKIENQNKFYLNIFKLNCLNKILPAHN